MRADELRVGVLSLERDIFCTVFEIKTKSTMGARRIHWIVSILSQTDTAPKIPKKRLPSRWYSY